MGLEAKANVVRRSGKEVVRASNASVLWEGDAFIVRGEARVKVARDDISKVEVRADDLIVSHNGGSIAIALGSELASKWRAKMEAKPKSRLEKLGVGQNTRVVLVGFADSPATQTLLQELSDVGAAVSTGPVAADDEVVLLLVEERAHLARIATAAKRLPDSAALWVVHPKGVPDVADVRVFDAAKRADLTYTKVASFSATHSAEKLVRPVALRASNSGKPKPRPAVTKPNGATSRTKRS